MLHNQAVCIMAPGQATTGWAAAEARADEERCTESESDAAPDSPTGSTLGQFGLILQEAKSLGSGFRKIRFRQAWWRYRVSINALKESRDTCLDSHAMENCVLDYPLGESSLHFHGFHCKEKPQREMWSIIFDSPFRYRAKCQFQIKVQLRTCQLIIWAKGRVWSCQGF